MSVARRRRNASLTVDSTTPIVARCTPLQSTLGKNSENIFFRAPAGKYGLDLRGALYLGGLPHFPKSLPYKAGFKGD